MTKPADHQFFPLLGAIGLVVLAFVLYWPALHGGFLMDDALLLTDNPLIKSPHGLIRFWFSTEPSDYWPISNTSLWLEWRMWGMNSSGYHATNILLHALNAWLLWRVLRRLGLREPAAFVAAVLYAVHPVAVQSVAWIAQRKNLLATLFFLLSILCYAHAEEKRLEQSLDDDGRGGSLGQWDWLSLAAFILAMLSKGSVAMLPLVLLGISIAGPFARSPRPNEKPRTGERPLLRILIRLSPFFLVAIALTLVNVWFQTHGAHHVIRAVTLPDRIAGAGAVVWFYLYKAVWPVGLVFFYPQWNIDAGDVMWWVPLLLVAGVSVFLWTVRARAWGRALLLAWAFFCLALVPVMGLTDVGFMQFSLVADVYQYIALMAVVALAAAGWGWWRDSARGATMRRLPANVAAVACVGVLAGLTFRQAHDYRDVQTLYRAAIERDPDNSFAHYMMGKVLTDAHQPDAALEQLEQAVRLNPRDATAQYDLGAALIAAGQLALAQPHLERAVELAPEFAEAHNNLGICLIGTDATAAEAHFRRAIALRSGYGEAYANLGGLLVRTGKLDEAMTDCREAVRLMPDDALAHNNLGLALAAVGQPEAALLEFAAAQRCNPHYAEAYLNRGAILARQGNVQAAIGEFDSALNAQPTMIQAALNLATANAQLHRHAEAARSLQKALMLAEASGQIELAQRIRTQLTIEQAKAGTTTPTTAHPAAQENGR